MLSLSSDDMDKGTEASTEFKLLLECARTEVDSERALRIRSLAAADVDWEFLTTAALRHGLAPLLYHQLKSNCPDLWPQAAIERLENLFISNAARNHQLTRELCRILKLFESNGIRAVPYKGPTLAQRAYGDTCLRQFNDLDLMVSREQMPDVSELLLSDGYTQQWQLTPQQETVYLKTDCERLFSRDGNVFLDVHWSVVRNYFPLSINLKSFRERLQSVALEECAVSAFAPEDELLILCVHASKDLWTKLIWVCDIALLLRASTQMDWQLVLSEAAQAGATRMLLLGLYLADNLLEARLPEEIRRRAQDDFAVRALAGQIKTRLLQTHEGANTASLAEFFYYLRLLEGARQKMKYMVRYWLTTNPADWDCVSLPDSLFFLYTFVRPWRLIFKRM